jgi:hypothetical protein
VPKHLFLRGNIILIGLFNNREKQQGNYYKLKLTIFPTIDGMQQNGLDSPLTSAAIR